MRGSSAGTASDPDGGGRPLSSPTRGAGSCRDAADCVRARLAEWLADWDDQDLAGFASLVTKFNRSTE